MMSRAILLRFIPQKHQESGVVPFCFAIQIYFQIQSLPGNSVSAGRPSQIQAPSSSWL